MKYMRYINVLGLIILSLSVFACLMGLMWGGGNGAYEFTSIHNEPVKIYGLGLYKNDSVAVAAQGRAQDLVTLVLAVPLLIISLALANKNSFRGKVILTGTIGYFLYTFISYVFLWNYNALFLIYVLLMAASLYAFILALLSFDIKNVPAHFSSKLPTAVLGGYQLFVALMLSLLWLGKIVPTIGDGSVPGGLEHYTTLVIQGMDLGLVVPAAALSGIMIIKRKPIGYLLTSVIVLKAITMLTSLSAMIINQALNGVTMPLMEVILFPALNVLTIIILIILMLNIKKVPLKSA